MLAPTTTTIFDEYRTSTDGMVSYSAGLPGYPHNFSRDTIIAGLLAQNAELLASQLAVSRHHQGTKYDPATGEEPGKIHHQLPGIEYRPGYVTTYNACDTAALYIIAYEALSRIEPSHPYLSVDSGPSLRAAVGYLLAHVRDDIFTEFPPPGAERFSIRVTYWKDSQFLSPYQDESAYPAVYTLAHFQAARALQAAGALLDEPELGRQAGRMFKQGISQYLKPEIFVAQQDANVIAVAPSSDELHALAYIPAGYRDQIPWSGVLARAARLATPAGYSCTTQAAANQLADTYHGYVVWPMEQPFIHYGLSKFGRSALAEIATRVVPYIGDGQELLAIGESVQPSGNPHQLWSVAARSYFAGPRELAL